MAARKSKALAKRNEFALPAALQDEFAEHINRDKASATGANTGWEFFKTAGGVLRYGEDEWPEDVPLVVLNAVHQNAYFAEAYDPANPVGPTCAAIDTEGDQLKMVPIDGPNKQAESCAECPLNAFGSNGRGKACKNSVVLTVLPFVDTQDYEGGAGARINVPPTSLKNWSQHARRVLDGMQRPLFSVATRISIDPGRGDGWKMLFDFDSPIQDEDLLLTLAERAKGDGWANATLAPDLASNSAGSSKPSGGARRIPARSTSNRRSSSGKKKTARKKKAARQR